jgi:hypothetical protein
MVDSPEKIGIQKASLPSDPSLQEDWLLFRGEQLGIDRSYQEGIFSLVENKIADLKDHGITGPATQRLVYSAYVGDQNLKVASRIGLLINVEGNKIGPKGKNEPKFAVADYVTYMIWRQWSAQANLTSFLQDKTGIHEFYLDYVHNLATYQLTHKIEQLDQFLDLLSGD